MEIILAGKHELAVKIFGLLKDSQYNVGVITSKTEDPKRQSLKQLLFELETEPLNQDYSHAELLRIVKQKKPDILISAGFDKIINQEVLSFVRFPINIHFGMLPKYRGSYSIPWAIINNEKKIGITLHKIDSGIDSGPIIFQTKIDNDPKRSCLDLYSEAIDKGSQLLKRFLSQIASGKKIYLADQNEPAASYYPLELPGNGRIVWRQTTAYVYNFIRAQYFPPYKPASTTVEGLEIGIKFPVKFHFAKSGHPGMVNYNRISTLNGFIEPEEIIYKGNIYRFKDLVKIKDLSGKTCL